MLLLDGPLGVPQAEPGSAAGVVAVLPHKVNLFLCECGHRDRFDAMWGSDSAPENNNSRKREKNMRLS